MTRILPALTSDVKPPKSPDSRWSTSLASEAWVCALLCARGWMPAKSLQQHGDVRKQRRWAGESFQRLFSLTAAQLQTLPPLHIWSKAMEVVPRFLFVCLCVPLAADWETVDATFTDLGDEIDYKDPCKAGTVHITVHDTSFSCCVLLVYFWLTARSLEGSNPCEKS